MQLLVSPASPEDNRSKKHEGGNVYVGKLPMTMSLSVCGTILRNHLKMHTKENPPNILKVFITSDLIPLEQQKQKQLQSQLC